MRKALRPYLKAGVAVAGAGIVAIAPVIATPPDLRVTNEGVALTSDPLDEYLQAIERAIAGARALLESAVAPQPSDGWTLGSALDSVVGDPAGSVKDYLDRRGADVDYLPMLVSGLRDGAAADVPGISDEGAADRIGLAVDHLLSLAVTLAVQSVRSATSGLNQLVGDGVNVVRTMAESVRKIAQAVDSGDPKLVLDAIVAVPASITARMLNGGHVIRDLGEPTDETIETGRFVNGILTRRPQISTSAPSMPSVTERVVTLDLEPDDNGRQAANPSGIRPIADPDDSTNLTAAADQEDQPSAGATNHRPRLSGVNSTIRSASGAGLSTLRQGIRDGIREFRNGVRDAVRTVTSRGDDGNQAGQDSSESPNP